MTHMHWLELRKTTWTPEFCHRKCVLPLPTAQQRLVSQATTVPPKITISTRIYSHRPLPAATWLWRTSFEKSHVHSHTKSVDQFSLHFTPLHPNSLQFTLVHSILFGIKLFVSLWFYSGLSLVRVFLSIKSLENHGRNCEERGGC